MPSRFDPCRAATLLLALVAGSAAQAQTYTPPPAPTAISPETAALAKCMATRNPDAFRARRLATSQSARHAEGRRIAAVLNTSVLGCPESLGAGFAKANVLEAVIAAAATLQRDDSAAPMPARRMAALATCLVTTRPAAARRFVDDAEAAASSARQAGGELATLSFAVDAGLVTTLLSESSCGAALAKVANKIDAGELYAEVLAQLPGPPEAPFAAHPIGDTGLLVGNEKATPALRPLAVCLWEQSRNRAVIITDAYMAQRDAKQFSVRLGRTELQACGGDAAVELAVANTPMLASLLFLIRQNQFARCLIARNRAGLVAALDALNAEGSRRSAASPPGDPRWLAIAIRPFASPMLDTMEGCDVGASDDLNSNGVARQGLLVEIDHELKQAAPAG